MSSPAHFGLESTPRLSSSPALSRLPPGRVGRLAIVGNGLVALGLCEALQEVAGACPEHVVIFGEEPRAAYDRVGLTSFAAPRESEAAWARWQKSDSAGRFECHFSDRIHFLDCDRRVAKSVRGTEIEFDAIVLATGAYPIVPPIPGIEKQGVLAFRSMEDRATLLTQTRGVRRCAILGSGLSALRAALEINDLRIDVTLIDSKPRLMDGILDDVGAGILRRNIESSGVEIRLQEFLVEIQGQGRVEQLALADGTSVDADLLIIAQGDAPRDELARLAGLEMAVGGGVLVDDDGRTSNPHVFAVGGGAVHATASRVPPRSPLSRLGRIVECLTGQRPNARHAFDAERYPFLGGELISLGDDRIPWAAGLSDTVADENLGRYQKLYPHDDGMSLDGGIFIGNATNSMRLALLARAGAAPIDELAAEFRWPDRWSHVDPWAETA